MSTFFRRHRRATIMSLFLALPALIGATCQPVKKTPPPTQVSPAPPGVNPCSTSTVVINAAQLCDWLIQRDANNATAGGFSAEQASIGSGSLKGGPIGAPAIEKFIAELGNADGNAPIMTVDELVSIAYDFLIAGTGKTDSAGNRPYVNVYTTFSDPAKFYDCRFDFVPPAGSTTVFTNVNFAATDEEGAGKLVNVREGTGVAAGTCPTNLADMPAGSLLRFFSISVGDTTASDVDLIGYIDNVQVATTAGTTTYDFEA